MEAPADPIAATDPRWKRTLGTIGAVWLGAVLLLAVYAKSLDIDRFAEQTAHEGLDFLLSAKAVAFVALGIEALLGLLLLFGVRRLWVIVPGTLLVAFFLFLTGRAWYLDAHGLAEPLAGCGCFGNLMEGTPAESFWRDLGLMLPALVLTWLGRPKGPPQPWNRLGLAGATTVAILVFAWMAPNLPLDDLATRLRPGLHVAEVCAGEGEERYCLSGTKYALPELAKGEHRVILTDLTETPFLDALPQLNEMQWAGETGFWIVTTTEKDSAAWFELETVYVMDADLMKHRIRIVPPSLFRPLHRALPRSFLVRDGTVVKTWSGMPPLPDAGE